MSRYDRELVTVKKSQLKKFYVDYINQKCIAKHTKELNTGLMQLYKSTQQLQHNFKEAISLCQFQNAIICDLMYKLIESGTIEENSFISGIEWNKSENNDYKVMKKKAENVKDFLLSVQDFGNETRIQKLEEERDKLKGLVESYDEKYKALGDRLVSMQRDYIILSNQLDEKKNLLEAFNKKLKGLQDETQPNESLSPKATGKINVQEVNVRGGAVLELLSPNKLREDPEGTDKMISCAYCHHSHPLNDYTKHSETCPKRRTLVKNLNK
ncbi:unnamed protein product [Dimorphilus gyrociliatus]|uniref:Uncharacterized protein n=1 Tax=Dimorphilus gyrociliatus TaxID=2664684 RepID=A0A7I8VIK3_9ANNE|nr:unnamed protein product [Dimorphilus gyrociliatus]